ncbi:arginine N-succinyltransferase [Halodesulfovibrio sp.]|jgi:arginine N-succinyltransferase|uniref:arginine N-succinyltransferase n=1 Tax=Halodesulfovibrio sp. TaxID=1912772 RepID=UPI0025F86B11|nr:arginine N-succinyltransferase [Halodesulfovibrio sp.]MCT4535559.1 arginine N-succinyltransferase [Halodesulfovibrio sp.]
MRFIVRGAQHEDLQELCRLAVQAPLLSLQAKPDILAERIETSIQSFAEKLPPEASIYQFVCEDLATKKLAGASTLFGSYISESSPQHYIEVIDKDESQQYRRGVETRRFSGLGGLLVDSMFRNTHYKLGSQLSHVRMLYAGMRPERFTPTLVLELLGKVNTKGQSYFWNCFGKKFTGMEFSEAFKRICCNDREFIDMFPKEYELPHGCSKARISENSVPLSSRGSQCLSKRLGFTFQNKVDPVDGALYYSAEYCNLVPLQKAAWYSYKQGNIKGNLHLLATLTKNGEFYGAMTHCGFQNGTAVIRNNICDALRAADSGSIFIAPRC